MSAEMAERTDESTLTPREMQVMELIAQGMRDKEIAALLNISPQTVHSHVKSLLTKLGVSNRTAAMNVALRRGIIRIR